MNIIPVDIASSSALHSLFRFLPNGGAPLCYIYIYMYTVYSYKFSVLCTKKTCIAAILRVASTSTASSSMIARATSIFFPGLQQLTVLLLVGLSDVGGGLAWPVCRVH